MTYKLKMNIRIAHKFASLLIILIFLSLGFFGIVFSLPEGKIKKQKYVKKGETWYIEEKGKLYKILQDVISVKLRPEVSKKEIDKFIQDYNLKIKNVSDLGIYDLELTKEHKIFHLLNELNQSKLIEFAELNTIGEFIVDSRQATEMIIQGKRFVKRENKWFLESKDRLYEVINNSLSLKFKKETTAEQRKKFLDFYKLSIVRVNRLGIYDVETPPEKNALECFSDLLEHPLLEFVEVNTLGIYVKK